MISDERSAAYIALGIAQYSNETVAIICTSGTAVLNFGPAIAEAFYQQIPLLVLTADRPPEWVDQGNGQTIRQSGIFHSHVKKDYDLPVDYAHPDAVWFIERTLNEAIDFTQFEPKGPVHINIPLREPLYPKHGQEITFTPSVRNIRTLPFQHNIGKDLTNEITQLFNQYPKRIIVSGQNRPNQELTLALTAFQQQLVTPIVAEIPANLQDVPQVIFHSDSLLSPVNTKLFEELQPELVITFGNDLVSRNVKTFFRSFPPKAHIHISSKAEIYDPLQSVTHRIQIDPISFFNQLDIKSIKPTDPIYLIKWISLDKETGIQLSKFVAKEPFGEFPVVKNILKTLTVKSIFNLSNSMSVRYANILSSKSLANKNIQIFTNRGTSGIDGCTSTALGAALSTDQLVVLITGDMAFLYDQNAFWHKYIPNNLRIVVLNNHGGIIFRLIDGPKALPELEEYFETDQQMLTAEKTAETYHLGYKKVTSLHHLDESIQAFLSPNNQAQILEIETDGTSNDAAFDRYKQSIQIIPQN